MLEIIDYPNPIKRRSLTQLLQDDFYFSTDGADWKKINVPYCPESEFSGIGNKDFIPVCYYKKRFSTMRKKDENLRAILHFGAVDYRADVYVNGTYTGTHCGGYTPFEFDVTDLLTDGENELFLQVRDDEIYNSARGKQSYKKQSFGCFYTRVTGIWQPVWIEYIPQNHIRDFYFSPDIEKPSVKIDVLTEGCGKFCARVYYHDREVGRAEAEVTYKAAFEVSLSEKHLWEAGSGALYDVVLQFESDEVHSYFGLRETRYEGRNYLLNGKRVFQRFVMDQGYYRGGVYTPLNIAEFEKDILRGKQLGFNGVRLHQKVSDPRLLYFCDKEGYLVWGEFPSWGIDYSDLKKAGEFISEWEEVLRRDFNHPSVITWCPLNEIWGAWEEPDKKGDVRFSQIVYHFTKIFDATRPCVDVSGGVHGGITDIFDFHSYEKPEDLKKYLNELDGENKLEVPLLYGDASDVRYKKDQPVSFSECGGIALTSRCENEEISEVNRGAVVSETDWGYGKREKEGEAFVQRYEELLSIIQNSKKLSGFCYTQLYDVEQEVNGFFRYDRSDKLSEEQKRRIREINLRKI